MRKLFVFLLMSFCLFNSSALAQKDFSIVSDSDGVTLYNINNVRIEQKYDNFNVFFRTDGKKSWSLLSDDIPDFVSNVNNSVRFGYNIQNKNFDKNIHSFRYWLYGSDNYKFVLDIVNNKYSIQLWNVGNNKVIESFEMPDETFHLIDITNNAYSNYKQVNKLQEECDEIKVKK